MKTHLHLKGVYTVAKGRDTQRGEGENKRRRKRQEGRGEREGRES